MKRKILWAFLIIWLILTAYLLFLSNKWASAATPSYAASSAVTTDNFAELLRETLQKNPDLLLSVLRENSEAVLDIAQEGSNQRRHKSLIAQWKAELNQPKEVDIKDRPFRGAADAPVTIVAYSDFTCPYCQQGAATMEKVLKENQGKIKYVFKHFPLETTGAARLAAEYHVAAARQDPELAWKFYDLLFARRADVLKDGEPAIVNAATNEYSAARARFSPSSIPPIIVEPERENPGHSAMHWQRPMPSASLGVTSSILEYLGGRFAQ